MGNRPAHRDLLKEHGVHRKDLPRVEVPAYKGMNKFRTKLQIQKTKKMRDARAANIEAAKKAK